jgi:hypothetical protein
MSISENSIQISFTSCQIFLSNVPFAPLHISNLPIERTRLHARRYGNV